MLRLFTLVTVLCIYSQLLTPGINPTFDMIHKCSCKVKDRLHLVSPQTAIWCNKFEENLQPLVNGDNALRFVFHNPSRSNFNYLYNPCVDFTAQPNICKGVAHKCQALLYQRFPKRNISSCLISVKETCYMTMVSSVHEYASPVLFPSTEHNIFD